MTTTLDLDKINTSIGLPEINSILRDADTALVNYMETEDVAYYIEFCENMEYLKRNTKYYKGHFFVDKDLEYLLFSATFSPIYDYSRQPYRIIGYKRND